MLAVVAAVILPVTFGSAIPIHSTGAGLNPGQLDPNYTLTVNALNNGTATYVAQGATVAELQSTGAPVAGWPVSGVWPIDPNAIWIAPRADVAAIAGVPGDTQYVYTTTFSLTGLDPTTAQLYGYWSADNFITQVQLNGQTISGPSNTSTSCTAPASNNSFYFQNLYGFDITSGFQSDENTLSFSVTNSTCYNTVPLTNPTGLFVDISGAAEPLSGPLSTSPEPGTLFPAILGLGLGLCLYRGRKK